MNTHAGRLSQFLSLLLLAAALVISGCDSSDNGGSDDDPPPADTTTIADLVAEDDRFSTLNDALNAEELVGTLDDVNTNFTVFAPTNSAFEALEEPTASDTLGSLLKYHVIEGDSLGSGDLSAGENTVTTLTGDELTIDVDDSGNVSVEGSPVTDADITADNGVVHAIGNKPLLGHLNLGTIAGLVAETQRLVQTIVQAGQQGQFSNADGWTVFAPNNASIDENSDTVNNLSEEELQQVLLYHTLARDADPVDSGTLVDALAENGGQLVLPTQQGDDLVIAQDGDGNVVFNPTDQGPQAVLDPNNVDYEGASSILHVIDGLLIPPSFGDAQQVTIAEARGLARDSISSGSDSSPAVAVEGTVTRAFGSYARFQDGSGPTGASGLVIRQTEGDLADQFQQDITDGNIAPGTVIRVTGKVSQFSGLLQFNNSGLNGYEIVEQGDAPDPQTVSLTDLGGPDGEEYESELLRVEGLSFPDASGSFEAGTNYTVEDGSGNTFTLRVQGEGESNVSGESIPDGTFDYEGVLSQFNDFSGVDTDEGYQLVPVQPSDLQ